MIEKTNTSNRWIETVSQVVSQCYRDKYQEHKCFSKFQLIMKYFWEKIIKWKFLV